MITPYSYSLTWCAIQDGPQLFGLYRPWEHEGHHHDHYQFADAGSEGDAMGTIEVHEEEEEEEEEAEEEEEE